MAVKTDRFPGFTALSDQVFVREGTGLQAGGTPSPEHPRVVIIYGWGDALPKHVTKYAEGFRVLYPHAKQIAVLSPIAKILRQDLQARVDSMDPVIEAAYPSPEATGPDESAVLVHVMSNTGGMSFASTVYGYQQKFNRPMPYRLCTLDSTPGGTSLYAGNVGRWSLAMALGTANWFPWPFAFTQFLMVLFLVANDVFERLTGRESVPKFSTRIMRNPTYVPKFAHKLYLYSKEDPIILWSDIEVDMAAAREIGQAADAVIFQGSGHVGHMRQFPEKYWNAIAAAWKKV
ncbi:Transmembrane protein 53-B [Colletotrichum chlorophyti]|uniref:Transmembrane protein 53-B n=1 Tax=Colletotrichum chlorophyti TaxID=708187 RepID=A0A1Q8RSH2_9PEZI|nr:Transmembrane protein 53-B [Colletotrichum chlorophyti]